MSEAGPASPRPSSHSTRGATTPTKCFEQPKQDKAATLIGALMPTSSRVEVMQTAERGLGLFVTGSADCRAGDVLVSIPLTSCISSADVAHFPWSKSLKPDDTYAQAVLALVALADAQERGITADPRAAYFLAVAPFGHFAATMLPMWPDDDATAQRLGHSICWQRSRVERQCLAQEHAALSAAGLRASLERYEWASMVMKTRAHARMDTGHALFPIIDLANHASVGATAKVVVDSGSVNLVAAYTLSPGDEVTICYDVNADYMDLVERYGFFDASSVIWTAEIGVSQDALCCADAASAALVSGLAEEGCCSEHGAWWVPDTKVEACPSSQRCARPSRRQRSEPPTASRPRSLLCAPGPSEQRRRLVPSSSPSFRRISTATAPPSRRIWWPSRSSRGAVNRLTMMVCHRLRSLSSESASRCVS